MLFKMGLENKIGLKQLCKNNRLVSQMSYGVTYDIPPQSGHMV